MLKKIVGIGVLCFGCITYAGTRASVDQKAGPGAFHASVNDGFRGAQESLNEAAHVPAYMVEAVKPGAQRLGAQFDGVLGGITGAPTGTTAPEQWDNRVPPSAQAAPNQ